MLPHRRAPALTQQPTPGDNNSCWHQLQHTMQGSGPTQPAAFLQHHTVMPPLSLSAAMATGSPESSAKAGGGSRHHTRTRQTPTCGAQGVMAQLAGGQQAAKKAGAYPPPHGPVTASIRPHRTGPAPTSHPKKHEKATESADNAAPSNPTPIPELVSAPCPTPTTSYTTLRCVRCAAAHTAAPNKPNIPPTCQFALPAANSTGRLGPPKQRTHGLQPYTVYTHTHASLKSIHPLHSSTLLQREQARLQRVMHWWAVRYTSNANMHNTD